MGRRQPRAPVDPKTLDRAQLESLYQRTLEAAARQLSLRALSAAGLRDKLANKGYPDEAIDYALAYLEERGYVDDEKFAAHVVRIYTRRGYGVMRLRQELARRGVDRETADAALAGCEPDLHAMRALLDKRLRGDLDDRKEVQKAIAALQRRGFLWDDIRRALDHYRTELADD